MNYKSLFSVILLSFMLCVLSAQPVNDFCSGAIPILPSADGTGCGTATFNFPFSTDGTTDSGLDGSCNNTATGLDQYFTWTATSNALRWNDASPGNPGIVVRENTGTPSAPQCGDEIDCANTFAATDFILSGWDIGDNLIFQVYDFGVSVSDIAFCVEEACLPPAFNLTLDASDCANDNYTITVHVTSTGDANLVDITNNVNGSSFIDQPAGSYQLTGFTGADGTVSVTVGDTVLTACLETKSFTLPTGCPPANDECANAVAVPVGPEGDCSNAPTFNFPNATNSGVGTCSTSNGLNRPDVWFSFVVPASGHVKIIPGNVTGSVDLKFELFENSCSNLNSILCDPTLIGASAIVANRTPGETLFIRIWEEGATTDDYFICVHEILNVDANDECVDAIGLNVSPIDQCNTQTISIGNSSYSGEGVCTDGFGDIANDTWYSFTVPNSGIVNIKTFLNSNPFMDMHLELFSGTCGSLTSEGCGGDGTNNINFTAFNLTPGSTAFLRIWEDFNTEVGDIDICISEAAANDHNDCDVAKVLTVNTTCNAVFMDNERATSSGQGICTFESGNNAPDVWASFVAPSSGTVTIETFSGSLTDMSMEVFTGPCTNLVSIACDDDTGGGGMNLIHVSNLTAGEVVFIRFWEAFGNQIGTFSVCVNEIIEPLPLINDDCAGAELLNLSNVGCDGFLTINSLGALPSNEPGLCSNGYGGAQRDFWYKVIVPTNGSFLVDVNVNINSTLRVENLGIDILTGNCGNLNSASCSIGTVGESITVSGLTAGEEVFIRLWGDGTEGEMDLCIQTSPANDECFDAEPLTLDLNFGCADPVVGTTLLATPSAEGTCTNSGGATGEDVWYVFDANQANGADVLLTVSQANFGFSPVVEIFSSLTGSCNDMTSIFCETNSSTVLLVLDNFLPNEVIFIRVWETFNSGPGEFTICASLVPTNDACSDAKMLPIGNAICEDPFTGTNILMTDSPEGTCTTGGGATALDAWFKVIVPASGNVTIETSDVDEISDTVMEILRGVDCGNLTSIACDDDGSDGNFSRIDITNATPGEELFIRVWEFSSNAFGSFNICAFEPPVNDECLGAIDLPVAADKVSCNAQVFNTIGATASNEFAACQNSFDDDIWFSFVAPSADIVIDIKSDNDFENIPAELYTGTTCANLGGQILACHSQWPFAVQNLNVGQTYFLRIASFPQAPSFIDFFDICIYETSIPINDECAGAINIPLGCDTFICGQTALATFSNDGICTNLNGDDNATDVWFSAIVPSSGSILFHIDTRKFDPLGIELYEGTTCGNKNSFDCFDFDGDNGDFHAVNLTPGSTVFLRIWDVNIGFAANGIFFDICAEDPEPANNNCVDAIFIPVEPTPCYNQTTGNNLGSTSENIGTCTIGGGASANDIWYQTMVPPSGKVTITTSGVVASLVNNTVLEVFTGADCANLTSIACGDQGPFDEFASVEITTEPAGTLLWIRVWEFENDTFDDFNICVIEPTSSADECIDAAEIAVHPGFCVDPVIASLEGATHSNDGSCTLGNGGSRPDIWFRLTVPPSGDLVITTLNAGGLIFNNTAMEIFDGDCGNLNSIACADNNAVNNYAEVQLTGLTPGDELFIRLWNAAFIPLGEGFFFLCAFEPTNAPPINDECAGVINVDFQVGDCVEVFGGTDLDATDSSPLVGPTNCPNTFNGKDVWYKFQIPANYETNNYFFQLQFASGSSMEFELYKGTCSNLESIPATCISIPTIFLPLEINFETLFGFDPANILDALATVGLAPGDDLFLRVWAVADGPASAGFCYRAENDCIMFGDADLDSICDDVDNCLNDANENQTDDDQDGVGNACDNCPNVANSDQLDSNMDGIGDACECLENVTLTTDPVPDNTTVSNDIIAGGQITITNGRNVLFDAGNSVTLTSQFEVEEGAELIIQIGGCTPPASTKPEVE